MIIKTTENKTIQRSSFIFQFSYWVLAVLLLFYVFSNRQYDINLRFILVGIMTGISVGVSMFVSRYLIPKLLFRDKIFLFYYAVLATLVVILWLIMLMIILILLFSIERRPFMIVPTREDLVILFSGTLLVVVVYSVIHFIRENYLRLLEQKDVEMKLSEAKLSLLKSQVNPHFIFNVLNNIYSLVNDDPVRTRAYILKFSNLLDLMLYEFSKKMIPVAKEVEFIENYIELERMRHDADFNIQFDHSSLSEQIEIPPLIFFPFVENAFKFGFGDSFKSDIRIHLSIIDDELYFSIKNRYEDKEFELKRNSGIGLRNIKERLNLLYKDRLDLNLDKSDVYFTVKLKIRL